MLHMFAHLMLLMVFPVFPLVLLFVKVNNWTQLKIVHNLGVDNAVKLWYMRDYISVDNVFPWKNIRENDNHSNHFSLEHRIKMVQHHNKVFYDREIISRVNINFDNRFDWYFHQLRRQIDRLYDRFHSLVDGKLYNFSIQN
jgi:hypothetical protein